MRETSPDPPIGMQFTLWHWLTILLLTVSWLFQVNFTGENVPLLLMASILLSGALVVASIGLPVVNLFSRRDYLPWLMVAIALWLLADPLFSVAPYRAWLYGWVWLSLPIVFFIVVQMRVLREAHLEYAVLLAGSALSLLAIYQFHILPEIHGYRAPGTLLDANSFAGLLNLMLLPCLAWLMRREGENNIWHWLALFLMVGGVCGTGSRAGMGIMIIGALLLILVAWRKGIGVKPGLIALLVMVVWIIEGMVFSDGDLARRVRMTSLNDPSVSARFLIWDSCWQLIQQSSWWGTGMGSFALLYPSTRALLETDTTGGYVHSDPLQLLLEGGLPMLVMVVLVFIATAIYLRKLWLADGAVNLPLFAMGLAVLLAAAHACVNFNLYNASILSLVALYLGLIFLNINAPVLRHVESVPGRVAVRAVIGLFASYCALMLVLDYQAETLQQPMMTKGMQAVYTPNQCERAKRLVQWRATMPGLSMVNGVCALKGNDCAGVRKALAHFQDAMDASPEQPELYAFAAQLELMGGQCVAGAREIAKEQLIKALKVNPTYFPARYLLYRMEMKAGDRKKAQLWISEGVKFGMNYQNRARYDALIKQFTDKVTAR